jgi:hypothetical protein
LLHAKSADAARLGSRPTSTNPKSAAGYRTSRQPAASLRGSSSAAGLRRRHFTGPSLVIGRSGRRPIASRRGCTRRHYAFSLIAPMPKRTAVDRRARAVRRAGQRHSRPAEAVARIQPIAEAAGLTDNGHRPVDPCASSCRRIRHITIRATALLLRRCR